ncbi:hypothetical protein TNCV_1944471 [Trichonephila clavipes]|nr:hypothetical protein TNCV_1944471 [Trichonephila clavipes]
MCGISLAEELQSVNPLPTCLPELRRALLDEWCNIPQYQIDNLILSMPKRFDSCRMRTRFTTVEEVQEKNGKYPKGTFFLELLPGMAALDA